MKTTRYEVPDIILFEPKIFRDDRGYFFESFNQKVFEGETGLHVNFVQDNHSQSTKNVLRGLHYQLPTMAQGKLIRVIQGEIFDVAVDIRKARLLLVNGLARFSPQRIKSNSGFRKGLPMDF